MSTADIKLILWAVAAFAMSGVLSFVLTPVSKSVAYKIGAVDVPKDERRMHKVPIPRLGGLAVFLGFLFSVLLFIPISTTLQGVLLGAVIIVLLGVIDDVMALGAPIKLIVQILAATIVVLHGTRIDAFPNLNLWSDASQIMISQPWSSIITVAWIVLITNAVNLIDGLDGLSVGICTIASLSLLVIAAIMADSSTVLMMAALAGACLGFLPYNVNPAKIFVGDTGATFLGFILASVSILGRFKIYAVASFAVPFLVLGLPLFDTIFAILRRLLHGQNPMTADRGHVHHRLIDMGFNQKQSVMILYLMSGLLGLSAVVLTSSGAIRALLLIVVVILAIIIGAKVYKEFQRSERRKNPPEDKKD